jgi:hypothetical protein
LIAIALSLVYTKEPNRAKEVKQRKTEKEERKHKTKISEEIPGQR